MTPWSDRAKQLERVKPGRGEFTAFLEWFSAKVDRCLPSGTPPILDTLTARQRLVLFAALNRAFAEATEEQTVVMEVTR